MNDDNRGYKSQLYPSNDVYLSNKDIDSKEKRWMYKVNNEEFVPSEYDAEKMYCLISKLKGIDKETNELKKMFSSKDNDEVKDFLRDIYLSLSKGNKNSEKLGWASELKVDVVKGSIYKIKKYFLENNNLKDIRGGSILIDYLNNEVVIETLSKSGFSEENIVYCGGGNIFIVVPSGEGKQICKYLEQAFGNIALTAMNAFESITISLYEFAFDFKHISGVLSEKLEERKKLRLYKVNPDNDLKSINIKGKSINFSEYEEAVELKGSGVVCKLCDIRDAKYLIEESDGLASVCPSCLRKHLSGKAKSIFYDEFKEQTQVELKYNNIKSIDDISDDIAVIYGDGNNMGKIVMEIQNVFEMMYFSRKTDTITKRSVYEAINETMGEDAKFEVIALGGDDIFIIVPAKDSFNITTKIIDKFDKGFNNEITMSIGIVISKSNTPIASLFSIAQQKLKSAKAIIKKSKDIKEGSVDIIELLGNMHINLNHKGVFPVTNSRLKLMLKEMEEFKIKNRASAQLHKISYAQKNMIEEEFELFYYYHESKKKNKDESIDQLIKRIYGKSKERAQPYKIRWDDLILIWKMV
ncbi:Cas10/Cmr2 second palm domain-containing protein [Clostridium diolis]|uniref:GGDEF domain-containing protein n=1 Tax=Clostridium diolis TaxID=223919 RepID=A0AAV3VXX2_9CLOT|nr:hypothetical protein [Clostridium diolis]QES74239.1 hypothetical protein F3K33_16015 [Clostridium diolis]GEA30797.1 hypothetical protein CDIOL_17200 [Clostridium diolis]